MDAPLLEVEDLSVSFVTLDGVLRAVRGVSFHVERGETLGIVGESGSGKSVSTQSIVGLVPGARVQGRALFRGRDLLSMERSELRRLRGAEIGMIFQDPLSSLHPFHRVGWQIAETLQEHGDIRRRAARARAVELLALVGIPNPERRADAYPHQLSGGMRQRVMIAMALALDPALLIADEPTTALDVTVQAQIMALLRRIQRELGTAIVLITHDLGLLAGFADRVMVMYAGRTMETAGLRTLFRESHHPYTEGLLESLPQSSARGERLQSIPGAPPSLLDPAMGCPFHPRCRYAMDRCRTEEPPLQLIGANDEHASACWLPVELTGVSAEVDAARMKVAAAHRTVASTGPSSEART